jgi:stress-induced morphogen
MTTQDLAARIEKLAPGTIVQVTDLTGTSDHFQAVIVSSAFVGKPMIQQHRMVMDLFKKEVASGELHALTLKTATP